MRHYGVLQMYRKQTQFTTQNKTPQTELYRNTIRSDGFKVGGTRGKSKKEATSDDVTILSQSW